MEGRSGGLAVFWKDGSNCRVLNYSRNFINMIVEDREAGDWRLTCYYGFPKCVCRRDAWDLLRELRDMSSLPWCIIGDFNDLLSQQDKAGIHPHPNWLCMGFREVVDDCALSDIKLHGHPFTRIKSPGTDRVLEERLDMAMGNSEWLQGFPEVKLTNLLTSHSDHTPILLDIIPTVRSRYNYSFKFENSWLLEDDIEEVVMDSWVGTIGLELGDRVVNCSTKWQSWGRRKRVRFKEEINQCVRILEDLCAQPNGMMRTQYIATCEKHARLLVQEEAFWKQRAKMLWLKEGDMNTKFFHTSAVARGKVKKVSKLRTDDGRTAALQEDMCNVAQSCFEQLFSANAGVHELLLDLMSQCISMDDKPFFRCNQTSPRAQMVLTRHFIKDFGMCVVMIFFRLWFLGWIAVTFLQTLQKQIFV